MSHINTKISFSEIRQCLPRKNKTESGPKNPQISIRDQPWPKPFGNTTLKNFTNLAKIFQNKQNRREFNSFNNHNLTWLGSVFLATPKHPKFPSPKQSHLPIPKRSNALRRHHSQTQTIWGPTVTMGTEKNMAAAGGVSRSSKSAIAYTNL